MKKDKSNASNPDTRIVKEIIRRLRRDSKIDISHLEVEVNNGSVVLNGKVDTEEEKNKIEKISASVKGVSNIESHLRIGMGIAQAISDFTSRISPEIDQDDNLRHIPPPNPD